MGRNKPRKKTSKLVSEIEKAYLLFFWGLLITLLIYWYFHEDYPLFLQVVVNSFNFFVLPYLVGFVYMFRSAEIKKEICKKKSIHIATDRVTPKLMRLNFWVIGIYLVLAIIGNSFELTFIKASIVEAFASCLISVAAVIIGIFGLGHNLLYVDLSMCFKQKR